MKRLSLFLLVLGAGCFQGVPENIPCTGDDECPTGYYCGGLWCSSLEKGSPEVLELGGVALSEAGPYGPSLVLPKNQYAQFRVQVKNTGGTDAYKVRLTHDAPACFGLETYSDASMVKAGGSDSMVVRLTGKPTSPCPAVDVKVTFTSTVAVSGAKPRVFTGVFRAE